MVQIENEYGLYPTPNCDIGCRQRYLKVTEKLPPQKNLISVVFRQKKKINDEKFP